MFSHFSMELAYTAGRVTIRVQANTYTIYRLSMAVTGKVTRRSKIYLPMDAIGECKEKINIIKIALGQFEKDIEAGRFSEDEPYKGFNKGVKKGRKKKKIELPVLHDGGFGSFLDKDKK